MSPLPLKIKNWFFLFLLCLALASLCFYLTGESSRHTYVQGDILFAKVSSLTSVDTLIPFSYYSLPYCLPREGIKLSTGGNIGGALMGDQVVNSPYRFLMNVNQSKYLCTTRPLSRDDVALLEMRTRELYQVNIALDSMPVLRYAKSRWHDYKWTGYPVGYAPSTSQDVYILNHLKFRISVHERKPDASRMIGAVSSEYGYEIVGFEVVLCSIRNHPEEAEAKLRMYDHVDSVNCPSEVEGSQIVKENEQISFTYEVEFVKSNLTWSSRWDPYVQMDVKLLWSSIVSSLISILFLSCIVLMIFWRSIWKELKMSDDELGKLIEAADNNLESLRWKLVVGDAFREPNHPKILCVLVGNGVQITIAAIIAVALALPGLVTPALRRLVLTQVIMLYFFTGPVGGYVSVTLWKMIRHTVEGWLFVSLTTGLLFPGILFFVHLMINSVLWKNNSTAALSISWYSVILSLWLLVSLPLTVLGGFLATRVETIQFPVHVNHIPRKIPEKRFPAWISIMASGIIPSGILFIQLFFILSSITFNINYNSFGFLLASLLMFIIGCGEVSLVLTYRNLSTENWRWWWKSFFASGSAGVYLLLYCLKFLVIDLVGLRHPATALVYLGYVLIATMSVMLSAGSIGLLVSFRFVLLLYSCIKV